MKATDLVMLIGVAAATRDTGMLSVLVYFTAVVYLYIRLRGAK